MNFGTRREQGPLANSGYKKNEKIQDKKDTKDLIVFALQLYCKYNKILVCRIL